jgi:hypothetical protein
VGKFKSELNKEKGLESALNSVTSERITSQIVKLTGQFIAKLDKEYFYPIITAEQKWGALSLLQKIWEGKSDRNVPITIVTTNYDNIIEYALDSVSIPYTLGLSEGLIRTIKWQHIEKPSDNINQRSEKVNH